jgi:hypothetical protein
MWYRFKIFLIFAIVGPPLGGLIVCPIVLCATGQCWSTGGGSASGGKALALCSIYGPLFGYVIGFVPATLAGLFLAIVKPAPIRRNAFRVTVFCTILAALTGGVLAAGHAAGAAEGSGSSSIAMAITLAGLVAGYICWRLVVRFA